MGCAGHAGGRLLYAGSKGRSGAWFPVGAREFSGEFGNFSGPPSVEVFLLFNCNFVNVIVKVVSRRPSGGKYGRGGSSRFAGVLFTFVPNVPRGELRD